MSKTVKFKKPVVTVTSTSPQIRRYDDMLHEDHETIREMFSHRSANSWAKHRAADEPFVPLANNSLKPLTFCLREVLPANIS